MSIIIIHKSVNRMMKSRHSRCCQHGMHSAIHHYQDVAPMWLMAQWNSRFHSADVTINWLQR